mgnify:CR=1 FL=1
MIYTSAEKLMVNDGRSCIEEPDEFPMTYAEPALFQTKTQMKQNNQSKILLPDYAAQPNWRAASVQPAVSGWGRAFIL